MAENGSKLVTYWVWLLGRPNPQNLNRRPKYCLGRLHLSQKYNIGHAVHAARKRWPQHQGHMQVEASPEMAG